MIPAEKLFDKLQRTRNGLKPVLKATLMLTSRCCLGCVHCFCTDAHEPELTTTEWKQAIDALAAAGCFSVLVTGGEPLVRPDFKELYLYVKSRGMLIDVFTNAVLINNEIISLFKEYPPVNVDVTVYGGNSEVFGRVTGKPMFFEKFERGLELLHENKIPFSLKAMVLKENEEDFEGVIRYARVYKTRFRMDANLWPGMNGSLAPLAHRADARIAAGNEILWPEIRKHLGKKICGRERGSAFPLNSRFLCGVENGGHESFISPQGVCAPCQGLLAWGVTMRRRVPVARNLSLFWEKFNRLNVARPVGRTCGQCRHLHICSFCPAAQLPEHAGSWGKPNNFLCAVNRERENIYGVRMRGKRGKKDSVPAVHKNKRADGIEHRRAGYCARAEAKKRRP